MSLAVSVKDSHNNWLFVIGESAPPVVLLFESPTTKKSQVPLLHVVGM